MSETRRQPYVHAALPYGLPPDPYAAFLSQLGLHERQADLAGYLSIPGNELTELRQMDPEDLDSGILEDDDLGLDDETKAKFRAAVAEMRQAAVVAEDGGGSADEPIDGTQRGAWLELMERYGGDSSSVSAEVAELREQLHASELREQQKDNVLLETILEKDEEIVALRQQLAQARS